MITLIVSIRIKPYSVAAWRRLTLENAAESLKEPGILAFDLLEDRADPCRFALVERYRDEDAIAKHKDTAHYQRWRDIGEPLQSEPRTRALYNTVGPESAS